MILYVNACVREESRTDIIARELIEKLVVLEGDKKTSCEELNLEKEYLSGKMKPLTRETLMKRDALIEAGDYSDSMFDYAKQFAEADTLVISAPFWDFSIPAILRIYLENIYAIGIVSRYNEEGMPVGLCKANKLYFVTTAGGPYIQTFAYDYIEALAKQAFSISETELIAAEMLDVEENNPEEIIREMIKSIKL